MGYSYPTVLQFNNIPDLSGNTQQDNVGMLRCQRHLTAKLPEPCNAVKVMIHVSSKENSDTYKLHDDLAALNLIAYNNGVKVGEASKALVNSKFIVLSLDSIQEFNTLQFIEELSEDKAFIIYMIQYTTAPSFVVSNAPATNADDHKKENGYSRKEPILKPNHNYRITVETEITGNGGEKATNYLYFRTDNGPGVTKDPYLKDEQGNPKAISYAAAG